MNITRRLFLKTSTLCAGIVGAAVGVPGVVQPSTALSLFRPNDFSCLSLIREILVYEISIDSMVSRWDIFSPKYNFRKNALAETPISELNAMSKKYFHNKFRRPAVRLLHDSMKQKGISFRDLRPLKMPDGINCRHPLSIH